MKKNLILDIGNVLMTYRWKDMLVDYGLSEEEALIVGGYCFDGNIWREMDKGMVLEKEVMEIMSYRHPEYADAYHYFFNHAELMVVGRPKVWDMVGKLKEAGMSLYLLSNYSENFFYKQITQTPILPMVDGAVISFQVHHLKPERAIYQILLDRYHLNRTESIFFDDRPENVEAAQNLGVDAVIVESEEGLLVELQKLLEEYHKV